MTTSEPGPELDRRVAEAIGYERIQVCVDASGGTAWMCGAKEGVGTFVDLLGFSTDPARIAEMVEWLRRERWESIEVELDPEGRYWARTADNTAQGEPDWIHGPWLGKTIEHALALLVVAVGDSSKHA